MPDRYGASPEAWRRWSSLGLTADLLPVVSNPHAEISERSTMKALGKTPSLYTAERKVVGLGKWTERVTTAADVERWAKEPDYGICVQTRRLKAIDVDVEDKPSAMAVATILIQRFNAFPRRVRKDSFRFLMPFWMEDGPLLKHVIPVAGGMVEILADGQQFVAEGTHPCGERYRWFEDFNRVPRLDQLDFAMLLAELKAIATGEVKIARQRREISSSADLILEDDVAKWLVEHWETYDAGADGQIFIACPFAGEHSSDTGPSSTAYFPAGTGGYADGNFVCLHAHCTGREQAEFLNATGFVGGSFAVLGEHQGRSAQQVDDGDDALSREDRRSKLSEGNDRDNNADTEVVGIERLDDGRTGLHDRQGQDADRDLGRHLGARDRQQERASRQELIEQERWPRLTRTGDGRIEPTMNNLLLGLAAPAFLERHIAYDAFKDLTVQASADRPFHQAQWRAFRDADYALIRQKLENRGFKPMGDQMLRLAVLTVAEQNSFDTAVEWLGRLTWDGAERVDAFCHTGWGWADTPYSRAVGRYTWSALAGRVMEPGIQADMAPILVGPQGELKTSAIKAMAPAPEFYASIALDAHDADTSRLLRGTLVAELEELRGLNSRGVEAIKAWLTKTHEKWVPKYREFTSTYGRRNLFFGSTNEEEFLADPTGERRWLPGRTIRRCDPDWIAANRDQLWAEGAAIFTLDGIDWSEAEVLARVEHNAFKVTDAWEPYVSHWLCNGQLDVGGGRPCEQDFLTTGDILAGAIHVPANQVDRAKQTRIGHVMHSLGWRRRRVPVGESRIWAYVKE